MSPSEGGGRGLGNVALQHAEQGGLVVDGIPQSRGPRCTGGRMERGGGPSCETNCNMDSGHERKQAGKSLNTGKHKPALTTTKVVKAGGNE